MEIESLAIVHAASPAPGKRLTVSIGAACIVPQARPHAVRVHPAGGRSALRREGARPQLRRDHGQGIRAAAHRRVSQGRIARRRGCADRGFSRRRRRTIGTFLISIDPSPIAIGAARNEECPLCYAPAMPERIRKLLVANRGEIAIRVFRAADRAGHPHRRHLFAGRPLRAAPLQGRRELSGRRRAEPVDAYLDIDGIVAHRQAAKRRRDPSRLRLPVREPRVRRGLRRGGHRSSSGRRRRSCALLGDKVERARAGGGGRRAGDAGNAAAAARRCRRPRELAARGRLSGDPQGELGRRRARHARGRSEAELAADGCDRRGARRKAAFGSAEVFLEKLIHARGTSRCRCSATARQPRAPVRARLLGAAAPPEGRRDRARRRSSTEQQRARAVRAGAADRPRRQLRQRRHGRVPASTPTPASSTSSRSTRASRSSTP